MSQLSLSAGGVARRLRLNPKDANGNPAALDPSNPPTWKVGDEALVRAFPAKDGLSCVFLPGKLAGETYVDILGDKNLSPGIFEPLDARVPIFVSGGVAENLGLAEDGVSQEEIDELLKQLEGGGEVVSPPAEGEAPPAEL